MLFTSQHSSGNFGVLTGTQRAEDARRVVASRVTPPGFLPPFPPGTGGAAPFWSSAAVLAAAGQDVAIGGSNAGATGAAQAHSLQLGRVGPAAGAAVFEGLLEYRAEGDQGVRA